MSGRWSVKLAFWERFRRKHLRQVYLVDFMEKVESELLFMATTRMLLGELSDYDKRRYLLLSKHFKWLRRIYKGMWPWGLHEKTDRPDAA